MTLPVMQPWVGPDEARAAAEAVSSGWLAQGPRVAAFETALAARVGAEHGVAVNSGTAALHLGLLLLGVGVGDEVVVPSLSYIATTSVVTYVGATPVFADVELSTQNLTAETVSEVVGPRTRAVIVVDQAGVPADVDSIRAALPPGVAVLEDAACGLGGMFRGRPIGAGPGLIAFSFHPRKVITTGEGGMLMINDSQERVERARSLREHGVSVGAWQRHRDGHPSREQFAEVGFNLRMSDVAAAVGSVQLGKLDRIVARRRELAAGYQRLLSDVPELAMAHDPEHGEANYQSFWVLLPNEFPIDRDQLLGEMERAGIACRRGIMAAHLEPAFAQLPLRAGLPNTERLAARSMILPLFHEMTVDDQIAVADVIRRCAGISLV